MLVHQQEQRSNCKSLVNDSLGFPGVGFPNTMPCTTNDVPLDVDRTQSASEVIVNRA